ncbi:MAG: hypothetical protein GZ086_07945 [Gelidibacter sp.]|nr:hypothetical protein [Gelidibacter sp.]
MRYYLTLFCALTLLVFSSCRKDFSAELSSGNLSFSKDTVYLDTVFTNIGSSTYNLKVYNKSNKNISIPSISLSKGESSFFRLNVDGIPGKIFENVEILAKDSLFIFIETTIDYGQVSDPIYTDAIVFDSDNNLQEVKLVTLVKDAHFLFPSKDSNGFIESISIGKTTDGEHLKVNGFFLEDNTTFTNEKPYVIYGYCAVPSSKTLTIEAGAKIHFHANSGLIVSKNATLTINGELNNKVIIEGDRLEPQFSEIPGQWGAIWLRAGSKNNSINNTIIKNASAGIIADSIGNNAAPTLIIKNSQIYNSSNFGILGRETNINGENLVINNSGQSSLACTVGGTYNFVHSTFTNYWNNSFRQYPSVLINNFFTYNKNNTQVVEKRDLHAANFTNCIIDGNSTIELVIDKVEGTVFNYSFKNNLIRVKDFSDPIHYIDNIFNGNPYFKSPENNKLIIGQNSEAIKKGSEAVSILVPKDILGITRSIPADIGAYQHINF